MIENGTITALLCIISVLLAAISLTLGLLLKSITSIRKDLTHWTEEFIRLKTQHDYLTNEGKNHCKNI